MPNTEHIQHAVHERFLSPLPAGPKLDREVSQAFGLKKVYLWSTSPRVADRALMELMRRGYKWRMLGGGHSADVETRFSLNVEDDRGGRVLVSGPTNPNWHANAPTFALVVARVVSSMAIEGPLKPRTI